MCDMRHFAAVGRLVGLVGLVAVGFSFEIGGFAGQATAAPTTTTVQTTFGNLGDCGVGVALCYIPQAVTVAVGDTVHWTDVSGFAHTVTRCDPQNCDGVDGGTGTDGPLDSIVAPDQDFSHTFTGAGTYVYYCQFHGYLNMNGLVTVTSAEETTTTTTTTTTSTTTTPATETET